MSTVVEDDVRLVQALRAGDDAAFSELVSRYHSSLLSVAMLYVKNRSVAEEVVQETWLGVIQGIERFENRSLLKTWIFRILTNRAKTRATREARSVPFSELAGFESDDEGPSVGPERFRGVDDRWAGHWASPPASWAGTPESRLVSKETLAVIRSAIEALPPAQAHVITLRDVEGWSSEEVCELLELSEANQRVLLHRARSKVRGVLERYLDSLETPR
jgi:RNA polymerase sigma-70 factor, ECF subfamily